jgi:hypothetical protein
VPRHLGHHFVGFGPRTDVDPDDQVPVLHWDQPPGVGDGVLPPLPMVVRAAEDVTDHPAGTLPRQRTATADRPASGQAPAGTPTGRMAEHPATHFHPPRMH